MKAYYQPSVPELKSAVIEGLPVGVTILKAEVKGVQNTGWKWQKGFPPGAALVVDGMSVTWDHMIGPNNPNTEYTVHVVGSDNFEDTVTVEARPDVPPSVTDWEAKYLALEAYIEARPK